MWIRQRQRVCAMWLAAPLRVALLGCSTTWLGNVDWSKRSRVVVLGDGAPWIWNLVAEHFPEAVQIVDLYHAKEHAWDVAHAVFGRGTGVGTAWATHACALLEQGQSEALGSAIHALPPIAPEPGHARSSPRRAVGYSTPNPPRS